MGKVLYKLLAIQTFRADRLLAMASIFVATVMEESFQHYADHEIDLATIVSKEVSVRGLGKIGEKIAWWP